MDKTRGQQVYATSDGRQALKIDVPFGLILPPSITAHVPLAGELTFYHADSYRIAVDPGALGAALAKD